LYYCSYCTILKNSLSNLLGFYQYHLLLAHWISWSQRLVFAFFGSEPIDGIVCYHFA
jgi:hypothetical protein